MASAILSLNYSVPRNSITFTRATITATGSTVFARHGQRQLWRRRRWQGIVLMPPRGRDTWWALNDSVSSAGSGSDDSLATSEMSPEGAQEFVKDSNMDSPEGDGETVAKEDCEGEAKVEECDGDGTATDVDEKTASTVTALLQSFKEALGNNDEPTINNIESFLLSIEDEKESLAKEMSELSAELLVEKDRILRISADFDNFRKRTERERLSLVENVQGEVVESLLPVLDNFERAKVQIKIESESEEKINNSYQSIYKEFVEILDSLGVEAVETVGCAFDPMLHEAIMREDSAEFEEGIILQEFRKGFKLGDRLLRPAMVKVSAGPGPATSVEPVLTVGENDGETSTEDDEGGEPTQ